MEEIALSSSRSWLLVQGQSTVKVVAARAVVVDDNTVVPVAGCGCGCCCSSSSYSYYSSYSSSYSSSSYSS